jgi:hypothetical protein
MAINFEKDLLGRSSKDRISNGLSLTKIFMEKQLSEQGLTKNVTWLRKF